VHLPDLHVIFWIAAVLLLIVEVVLGLGTGVPLSGAVSLFVLGVLQWMGVLQSLNGYLLVGSIVFAASTFLILRYFRGWATGISRKQDVNDY